MRRHRHLANDSGYTLAELAVGLALTAVIAAIAALLVIGSISGLESSRRAADRVQTVHTAWLHLSDELRRADQVTPTDAGWSIGFADSTVSYMMSEEGLYREGRRFAPVPDIQLRGSLASITVDDTVRAHELNIVAIGRENVSITSTVRRAPPASWKPLADR